GADGDADRATVILHEEADGSHSYADGAPVVASVGEAVRCDCREQHADGSVDQVISPSLRRKVLATYRGCTFPSCEQRRWLPFRGADPPAASFSESQERRLSAPSSRQRPREPRPQ